MSGNRESEKGIVDDNFPHWMVMPLFIGEIPFSDGWIYICIYVWYLSHYCSWRSPHFAWFVISSYPLQSVNHPMIIPSPEPQIFGPQNSWLLRAHAQSVWIPRFTDQGIKGWTNWRVELKPYVSGWWFGTMEFYVSIYWE
jgi:hypothetical protein